MIPGPTQRLYFRVPRENQAAFILRLVNSPGWLKYIGDRKVYSMADAKQYIRSRILGDFQRESTGLFEVRLKSNDRPIGLCGLLKRDFLPAPDIGFALLPEYAGAGYAYEAAHQIINWSFEEQNLPTILAITLEENLRSRKLLTRLGMKLKPEKVKEPGQEPLLLYSLSNPTCQHVRCEEIDQL